ncbi:MAG TPA: MarC family protein [Gemmatimonadaceae bacterium]|nr:MarC family protein [Gemmatimonadaceae bacterium]
MTLISAVVLIFFVMDPLGNVPLFLSALRHVDPARHRRIIVRELFIALIVMIAFLFTGRYLLSVLHVSPAALTAAGGVILLLIALRMIFPSSERTLREEVREEPFVVPLAVPYTAGPSVLATELLLMSREPERWPVWLAAVFLAWIGASVILFLSSDLRRVLGDRGLTALERLMGMLLVIVSVEMLMQGIGQYLGLATGTP